MTLHLYYAWMSSLYSRLRLDVVSPCHMLCQKLRVPQGGCSGTGTPHARTATRGCLTVTVHLAQA